MIYFFYINYYLIYVVNKRSKKIGTRVSLNVKQRKALLSKLSSIVEDVSLLVHKKASVEKLILDEKRILYFSDGVAVAVQVGDIIVPFLKRLRNIKVICPFVIVDVGAIRFITNGADVMRPGITKINGEFKEGDIVLVREEKAGSPLAFGVSMFSSEELISIKKGKVIKNIHHLRDDFWDMAE